MSQRTQNIIRFLFALLLALGIARWSHAQPSRAVQAANGKRLLAYAASKTYVRELTGNNDGPEIDAWCRALGIPLRSFWCGAYQAGVQRACKLPYPSAAGGARYWTLKNSPRTYYIQGLRGSPDSIKPAHIVTYYYANLGRVGHVGRTVAPGRAVRKGRPARVWTTNEGNTGRGGGRNGGGVHVLTRTPSDFYAAANYNY